MQNEERDVAAGGVEKRGWIKKNGFGMKSVFKSLSEYTLAATRRRLSRRHGLAGRRGGRRSCIFDFPFFIMVLLVAVIAGGCATPPLAPANLSAAGWRVQQGQAVWRPSQNRREIAGDLIMATNSDGDCFIQFTKTPLTLATAQIPGGRWQLEFGNDQYSWRGSGAPPDRFVWFQLPRAFSGAPLQGDWHFQTSANGWQFDNSRTGENLEGEFFQ